MKFSKLLFLLTLIIPSMVFITSCGDDDDEMPPVTGDNPVSSFQFDIDDTDFLTVHFDNFSDNATSYSWDFDDGTSSTEESPSHTYAASGDYDVTLTATNANGSAMSSKTVTVTDPNVALKLLTGDVSKTWKLFREGTAMSLGTVDNPTLYWPGLTNDGSRPCLYEQEHTFNIDGTFSFDDKGMFWGEFGVYNNVAGCDQSNTPEGCYDADPAAMINACGEDVSAWGSGTHAFTYDASTGELTLTGEGAFIGIPKLGTNGAVLVPESSVSTTISIEEFNGYDVMLVEFTYGGDYWPIRYASYSDASLEPDVVTEAEEFGEDLPDVSPTEMFRTFASNEDGEWALLDTITSNSTVEYGVDDPADAAAAKVGQFNRTGAQFQELQFQTSPDKFDINFENLTTVSLDVYIPSSNDYSGGLTQAIIIGLADVSKTEQWWTDHQQYENDGSTLPQDEWVTIAFNLDSPTFIANSANGTTPYERNDYDMVLINIGGANHTDTGTFYVRNFRFE